MCWPITSCSTAVSAAELSLYFAAILIFAGALWWFNHQRQVRLDADPGQQHLASLLVAAANGTPGMSEARVAAHLAGLAKGSADRRVRLTHAVMLVRGQASPEQYAKVLELARRL